jgi:hypothetical protein
LEKPVEKPLKARQMGRIIEAEVDGKPERGSGSCAAEVLRVKQDELASDIVNIKDVSLKQQRDKPVLKTSAREKLLVKGKKSQPEKSGGKKNRLKGHISLAKKVLAVDRLESGLSQVPLSYLPHVTC